MSFPQGVPTIEVTGKNLRDFGGSPLSGVVMFTASEEVADPAANLLLEGSATGISGRRMKVP